jgi:hypothetical protein
MPERDDEEYRVWRHAMDGLLAKGENVADAMEGANLILQAYRRKRDNPVRQSGTRRVGDGDPVPEPDDGSETG